MVVINAPKLICSPRKLKVLAGHHCSVFTPNVWTLALA